MRAYILSVFIKLENGKKLFVCNQGKYRSPTAANYWKKIHPKDEVKFLGLFIDKKVKDKIDWADKIYVMELQQYDEIMKISNKLETMQKIVILNIEDIYTYNDKRLIKILEKKLK